MLPERRTGATLGDIRLTTDPSRYPSIIFIAAARAPPPERPNWDNGCLLFRDELSGILAPVRAATDDLPVTKYLLTQRQAIKGVEPGRDARYFGCSAGSVALRSLLPAIPAN